MFICFKNINAIKKSAEIKEKNFRATATRYPAANGTDTSEVRIKNDKDAKLAVWMSEWKNEILFQQSKTFFRLEKQIFIFLFGWELDLNISRTLLEFAALVPPMTKQ